jgi:hypothetical protein
MHVAECADIVEKEGNMRNTARSYWRRGLSRLSLVQHVRG